MSAKAPSRGDSVPISSAAERPSGVSEIWRNAVRRVSAGAGSSIWRSSSPGASTLLLRPGDEIDDRRCAARRRPASRSCTTPSSAAVERDHRPGRQRHADIAADGRGVPDLERSQERAAALADQRRRDPVGRQRRRFELRRPCRSRRSASPRSSDLERPASRRPARSISRLQCGCGSENSQVPPPSQASPACQRGNRRRRRAAGQPR